MANKNVQTEITLLTNTEGHALARDVLLARPSGDPAGIGVVVMEFRFQHVAECPLRHQVMQGATVAVKSPV